MARKIKDGGGAKGISLQEYIEMLLEKQERRYNDKFNTIDKNVMTAFTASEKAIIKAEEAQKSKASQMSVIMSYIIAILGLLISIFFKYGSK